MNTASRMETSGPVGEIQVSERAYQRLADRYRFSPRGGVEVKGKGSITTYLLISQLDQTEETVSPRAAGADPS